MKKINTFIKNNNIELPEDFKNDKEVMVILFEDKNQEKLETIRKKISSKISYSISEKLIEERG